MKNILPERINYFRVFRIAKKGMFILLPLTLLYLFIESDQYLRLKYTNHPKKIIEIDHIETYPSIKGIKIFYVNGSSKSIDDSSLKNWSEDYNDILIQIKQNQIINKLYYCYEIEGSQLKVKGMNEHGINEFSSRNFKELVKNRVCKC